MSGRQTPPAEIFIQDLWKRYCTALTIEERLNPKLQIRCMPKRYWPYLLEKQAGKDVILCP